MARTHVNTVGELLALALAMELRAAARFRRLAGRMREDGRDDLAVLFEGLAREEDAHAERLRESPGMPASDVEALVRDLAPDLAEMAPARDEHALGQMSVYHSLAEAVRNEIKAFEFYSDIAATADAAALQDLAENLAREELDHANALRRLRRQAYHRFRRKVGPWPKASEVETVSDLRAAAARGEQAIAASLSVLYRQLPELEEIARAVTDILAPPAQVEHGTANPVSSDDGGRALDAAKRSLDRDRVGIALSSATEAFEFYDAVVSTASREDIMLTAQALSTCALKRIQLLRSSTA
jgi:rubrerythrin